MMHRRWLCTDLKREKTIALHHRIQSVRSQRFYRATYSVFTFHSSEWWIESEHCCRWIGAKMIKATVMPWQRTRSFASSDSAERKGEWSKWKWETLNRCTTRDMLEQMRSNFFLLVSLLLLCAFNWNGERLQREQCNEWIHKEMQRNGTPNGRWRGWNTKESWWRGNERERESPFTQIEWQKKICHVKWRDTFFIFFKKKKCGRRAVGMVIWWPSKFETSPSRGIRSIDWDILVVEIKFDFDWRSVERTQTPINKAAPINFEIETLRSYDVDATDPN